MMGNISVSDIVFFCAAITAMLLSVFLAPVIGWYFRKHPRKKPGQDERKK